MKKTLKYLPAVILLLAVIFSSGCVSSQRVAGKRYTFLSPGPELPGIYTYEKDYTSVSMVQKPEDYIFFSAENPNVGLGDSSIGSIKTVEGSRHQFLWGIFSFQNP
jgi:hypothetical protein